VVEVEEVAAVQREEEVRGKGRRSGVFRRKV
jgi:hypothetical protein